VETPGAVTIKRGACLAPNLDTKKGGNPTVVGFIAEGEEKERDSPET